MSGEFGAAQLKLLFIDVCGTLISVRDSCYGACTRIAADGGPRTSTSGPSGRLARAQHCAGSGI